MLNKEKLEAELSQLPLYTYHFITPDDLEFTQRIRYICKHDCPMYGKTWACPPGVGSVESCEKKCRAYKNCLMISTITEVSDISDIQETLSTRPQHEAVADQVLQLMRQRGEDPYVLSTEACTLCERCTYLDGKPCRHPEKMHPCIESHGINILALLDDLGLSFQYGENVVTWFSLLFY